MLNVKTPWDRGETVSLWEAWNNIVLHMLINMLYVSAVNPAPFIVIGIKIKWALLRRQDFISACVWWNVIVCFQSFSPRSPSPLCRHAEATPPLLIWTATWAVKGPAACTCAGVWGHSKPLKAKLSKDFRRWRLTYFNLPSFCQIICVSPAAVFYPSSTPAALVMSRNTKYDALWCHCDTDTLSCE